MLPKDLLGLQLEYRALTKRTEGSDAHFTNLDIMRNILEILGAGSTMVNDKDVADGCTAQQ
jgi:hypothetical protein